MLRSWSPSKSPQSKSKSQSFIHKKSKQPYFVWNIKKLGETIDADFDVFKARCAVCEEERTTITGFARVERSSKILQGTIVLNKFGKFNPLAEVNPQAQADTWRKRQSFDFNKNKCARTLESWRWDRAGRCRPQLLMQPPHRYKLYFCWKGIAYLRWLE